MLLPDEQLKMKEFWYSNANAVNATANASLVGGTGHWEEEKGRRRRKRQERSSDEGTNARAPFLVLTW